MISLKKQSACGSWAAVTVTRVITLTYDQRPTRLTFVAMAGLSPSHSPKGADIHGDNVWECHTEPVLACCYSKTGETVVAASHDKSLSVWNAKGQLLKKLEGGHTSAIYWCALSPDLETVASASHDETLKLWNLAEGRWFANLRGHEAPVRSCDFSPDGKLLASASYDKTCKIWEIDGTRCIQTLKGHRGMVRSVNFAPNGELQSLHPAVALFLYLSVSVCPSL